MAPVRINDELVVIPEMVAAVTSSRWYDQYHISLVLVGGSHMGIEAQHRKTWWTDDQFENHRPKPGETQHVETDEQYAQRVADRVLELARLIHGT